MSARIINLDRERHRRAREAAGEAAVRLGEARLLRELRAARQAHDLHRLEKHRREGRKRGDGS